MHPSNCMLDCKEEDCSCTPSRHYLVSMAAGDLFKSAKAALDYLASRNLDGGQVGASLHNAIEKAKFGRHTKDKS